MINDKCPFQFSILLCDSLHLFTVLQENMHLSRTGNEYDFFTLPVFSCLYRKDMVKFDF